MDQTSYIQEYVYMYMHFHTYTHAVTTCKKRDCIFEGASKGVWEDFEEENRGEKCCN